MTKFSVMVFAAIAFTAMSANAASINGPYRRYEPSHVYEREVLGTNSELSSRMTVERNEMEHSALYRHDDSSNEIERRLLGKLFAADALALGIDHLYNEHEQKKAAATASSTSAAPATSTSTAD